MTQELYRRELSRYYHVFSGSNEREALHFLQTQDICAVVLEPAWAGETGWQFLESARQGALLRSIPIVICSVWDERRYGREMGAAAYLVKPVLPAALLETLQHVLKGRTDERPASTPLKHRPSPPSSRPSDRSDP